jgi:squalene synthase HpnC
VAHTSHAIEEAFRECERIAREHYENFPVASLFIPKRLRPSVAAIYAFARTADDFADEGTRAPSERLHLLDDWQNKLDACYAGNADHPVFIALGEVVRSKGIPERLLSNLLTAFRMDVTKQRYQTFEDLLSYCTHSANPVGRLVLHLFEDEGERHFHLSDNICTALQLANFWQDIRVDADKGRVYIPLEDMERFGYTENNLLMRQYNDRFADLLRFEVERTRELFAAGKPLLHEAASKLRFELRLTWSGGVAILSKIEQQRFNVFAARPTITTADKILIFMRALLRQTL